MNQMSQRMRRQRRWYRIMIMITKIQQGARNTVDCILLAKQEKAANVV